MSKFLPLAVLGILTSLAVAEPLKESLAVSVVKEAAFYVGFHYNGPQKQLAWRELTSKYLAILAPMCGGKLDCPVEKGLAVVRQMTSDIGDPFTAIQSESEVNDEIRFSEGRGSELPTLGLRASDFAAGGLIVLEAYPGEPAFDAGVQRGDVILKIGGQPATAALLTQAQGATSAVALELSRRGTPQTISVAPKVVEEGRVPTRSSAAGGKVMVLRIPNVYGSATASVGNRVHQNVRRAIADNVTGIVIDLRDSASGFDSEALLAAGAFAKSITYVADTRFLNDDETITVNAGAVTAKLDDGRSGDLGQAQSPQLFTKKVVVLTGPRTENSSEMLAYWLQRYGGATVIGTPTIGMLGVSGGNSYFGKAFDLLSGDYMRVSVIRMLDEKRQPYPLRVTPDQVLAEDLSALAQGRDVQLEAALKVFGL